MSQSIGYSSQLGEEEEYIYLQTKTENTIHVNVAWTLAPDKHVLVPLHLS